jgi:transcriptional regulator with XRE-family HTH domain
MNQQTLGAAAGISFQQIQKFEDGSNRCSSSQLYEFAKALDVPVSYFFDEMSSGTLKDSAKPEKDPLIKRETLELVRAYYKIGNNRSRKRIFEMVKAVGAAGYSQELGARKRVQSRR